MKLLLVSFRVLSVEYLHDLDRRMQKENEKNTENLLRKHN